MIQLLVMDMFKFCKVLIHLFVAMDLIVNFLLSIPTSVCLHEILDVLYVSLKDRKLNIKLFSFLIRVY